MLSMYVNRDDEEGVKRYFEEKECLDELMKQEETYWKQRAKAFWLTEGDTNSKFFHTRASVWKKFNRIEHFKNEKGDIIDKHEEICKMTVEYFRIVFKGSSEESNIQTGEETRVVTARQKFELTKDSEFEEFINVVKQMHQDKASGPDGFVPAFFQHFWSLIGKEIFDNYRKWLCDCSLPQDLNNTTLVLIMLKE